MSSAGEPVCGRCGEPLRLPLTHICPALNESGGMTNVTIHLSPPDDPYAVQVGGTHYKNFPIQPAHFSERNKLSFLAGCVVKRVARHNQPGGKGRQDLEKAIHEIQLMIEEHYPVNERGARHAQ